MAKVLKSFDFSESGHSKYPWDQWADGRIWQLRAGEDFTASVPSFRVAAGTWARRNGRKVRISARGATGTVTLQFYDAE